MKQELRFINREEFRNWLTKNNDISEGVWLIFENNKTLSAPEALEEALCFGWIDGLMQNIAKGIYKKYFAKRTKNSKWSEKNKRIVTELINKGLVEKPGLIAIEQAKQNGVWDKIQTITITPEQEKLFDSLIKPNELAYINFQNFPKSIRTTYARAYFDAKTEETKARRLAKIIERLMQNLKPM